MNEIDNSLILTENEFNDINSCFEQYINSKWYQFLYRHNIKKKYRNLGRMFAIRYNYAVDNVFTACMLMAESPLNNEHSRYEKIKKSVREGNKINMEIVYYAIFMVHFSRYIDTKSIKSKKHASESYAKINKQRIIKWKHLF